MLKNKKSSEIEFSFLCIKQHKMDGRK